MCRGRCVLTFFSAREPSLCAVFTRFQDWDVSMPSCHFAQRVTFGGTAPPRGSSWLRAGKSDRSGGVAGGSRRRQTSTTLRLLVISRLKCLLTFFNFCCVPVRDTMQTERRSPLPGSWVRSFGEGFRAHTCPHVPTHTRRELSFYKMLLQVTGLQGALSPHTPPLVQLFLRWQSTYNIKFTFSTIFKRAVQRHQVQSQSSAPGPTTHLAWLHRPGPRLGVSCPSPSPALASSALSTRPALSRVPRVTVHSGCGRACGQSSGGDAPTRWCASARCSREHSAGTRGGRAPPWPQQAGAPGPGSGRPHPAPPAVCPGAGPLTRLGKAPVRQGVRRAAAHGRLARCRVPGETDPGRWQAARSLWQPQTPGGPAAPPSGCAASAAPQDAG